MKTKLISAVSIAMLVSAVFLGLISIPTVKAQDSESLEEDVTTRGWLNFLFVLAVAAIIVAVAWAKLNESKSRRPRRRSPLKASLITSCLLPLALLPEHAEKANRELWAMILFVAAGSLLLIFALRCLRRRSAGYKPL